MKFRLTTWRGTHPTKEHEMFILKNIIGEVALMANGDAFLYSSAELAAMGAKALQSTKGNLRVFAN